MKIKSMTVMVGLAAALQAQEPPAADANPVTKTQNRSVTTGTAATASSGRAGGGGFGSGAVAGMGGGGMGGGFGGGMSGGPNPFAGRLNAIVARSAAQNAGTVAIFAPRPQKELDELAEDLNVLAHIASRNLERSLGDKQTEYRLGVPMLMDGRLVQARYIEGFGVLVSVNVPFPVAASGKAEKKSEPANTESEWDRVKASIYGGDQASQAGSNEGLRYDEKLVAAVKKQMLDAVRNGANVRHLKADESIAVIVYGGANSGDPAEASRSTVLTLRAKKSAADASAKEMTEQFERDTQVNAYLSGGAIPSGRAGFGLFGESYGYGTSGSAAATTVTR